MYYNTSICPIDDKNLVEDYKEEVEARQKKMIELQAEHKIELKKAKQAADSSVETRFLFQGILAFVRLCLIYFWWNPNLQTRRTSSYVMFRDVRRWTAFNSVQTSKKQASKQARNPCLCIHTF